MSDEPNVRVRVHKESGQPLSAEELAELREALATADPVTPDQLLSFLSDESPLVVRRGAHAVREWSDKYDQPAT